MHNYGKLQNSNSSSAKVFQGALGPTALLTFTSKCHAKHLSVVEKSTFTDILGEAAGSHTLLLSTGM